MQTFDVFFFVSLLKLLNSQITDDLKCHAAHVTSL